VTVKSEPSGLIEREWSDWYDLGESVETPRAPEVPVDRADMRLVLDGWYVNNARQPGNPIDLGGGFVCVAQEALKKLRLSAPPTLYSNIGSSREKQ